MTMNKLLDENGQPTGSFIHRYTGTGIFGGVVIKIPEDHIVDGNVMITPIDTFGPSYALNKVEDTLPPAPLMEGFVRTETGIKLNSVSDSVNSPGNDFYLEYQIKTPAKME